MNINKNKRKKLVSQKLEFESKYLKLKNKRLKEIIKAILALE